MTDALTQVAETALSEDAAIVEETAERFERPIEQTIEWLAENWQGLSIGALVALGIVGLMLIARTIGRRYQDRHPERTSFKDIIASVFAKTTLIFMVVAASNIVIHYTKVPATIDRLFDIAFIVVAALQGAIWARELILGIITSKVAEDDDPESTLANALSLIRVLVSIAAFAIAILIILDNLGVDVGPLIAGFGIGGIAIGLAAQGIFSDLFAALSIVFDKPFKKGDTITYGGVGGTVGTVEKVGMKSTRIRSVTGEQVVINNTKLLDQEVSNINEAFKRRRTIPFGVIYQTSPKKLKQMRALCEEALSGFDEIEIVRCVCTGFGDSSINFELVYEHESTDFNEIVGTQSLIHITMLEIFSREGIEFAYPTQTTFTSAPDGTMIMPYPAALSGALAEIDQRDDPPAARKPAAKVRQAKSSPDTDCE
ncbi:mechanosensitive ion channel domain-containing protein [Sphingomicrobium clamense]|uniref:Mechanosensitive ion channel family protein n=1 Tax=Sphingomicrobium clamense TaxID=2851013 RepID=A0ABS6V775_9SPHN|nr:mechanosensitive ion channel domain-containing protein [Sphingomicrobium sp. B8]MBW0145424.1 mechanosensitive ion channel family protein [Sphingomicrobium sp. B8]